VLALWHHKLSLKPVTPPNTVDMAQAPPAPQVEVVPVGPGPDYVWMPGYWYLCQQRIAEEKGCQPLMREVECGDPSSIFQKRDQIREFLPCHCLLQLIRHEGETGRGHARDVAAQNPIGSPHRSLQGDAGRRLKGDQAS